MTPKRIDRPFLVKEIVLTTLTAPDYALPTMTHAVKWLYLLTLAAWIGSIIFFSFIIAPTIFKTLKPDDAAALIRRIFSHYYLLGILCAAVAIASLGFMLSDRSFSKYPAILSLLLIAAMGATDLWLRQGLMPHMNSLRDRRAALASSAQPPDPTLDREWQSLHRLSVQLNLTILLCGFVLLFLLIHSRVV
jgi:uncharacterized membrane protein